MVRANTVHYRFGIAQRQRPAGFEPALCVQEQYSRGEELDGPTPPTEDELDDGQDELDEDGLPTCVLGDQKLAALKAARLLIVDEVSMLCSEYVELLNGALQHIHNNRKPWGGVTVLFVGDFLQLEPVVTNKCAQARMGDAVFAFDALAWQTLAPVRLTEVRRQRDPEFARVLNCIRVGAASAQDLQWLKARARRGGEPERALYPWRSLCAAHNNRRMESLPGATLTALAEEIVLNNAGELCDCPRGVKRPGGQKAPRELKLKVGARVRCVKNLYLNVDGSAVLTHFNGQTGTVAELTPLRVRWDALNGAAGEPELLRRSWWRRETTLHSGGETSTFTACYVQFPVDVAFATTTHSSQGATVHGAVDVSLNTKFGDVVKQPPKFDAYYPSSLAYVSLSRATDVANISLRANRLQPEMLRAHPRCLAYEQRIGGD